MRSNDVKSLTWQEALVQEGIDSSLSKKLIGFVSWNKDEDVSGLGEDITRILSSYEGKVYVQDVVSRE